MKKSIFGGILVIVAVVLFFTIGGKEKNTINKDVVYQNTISVSRTYVALRVKTDKLLTKASEYPDYDTWNKDMTKLINNWQNFATKAADLEVQADAISTEKVGLRVVNTAHAYSKSEISNVFDKAPAGKKIKTLAKYLGVDAKRAYKILKSDQEFVKADAWNEAGDTFKKLETSAVVIKDGCKVAGFIGAAALTGGASATASIGGAGVGTALVGGSATALEASTMVVTGTDLMLEVGEDGATIALGDNHKAVKAISNIRGYTEPAASLLSLTDIPANVGKMASKLDKVGVVLVEVEQMRSVIQDGKLLGINIKPSDKKADNKPTVEAAALKEGEIQQWMEENQKDMQIVEEPEIKDENMSGDLAVESVDGIPDELDAWLEGFEDLDDWMDDFDEETKNEQSTDEELNNKQTNNKDVAAGSEGGNVVDAYMREMQSKDMNDLKVFLGYGNTFEDLYDQGVITREEQDALMVEARRLNEGKAQEARSVEEQETELLDKNYEKYVQINKKRPPMDEIFKMSEVQREALEDEIAHEQAARDAWLKTECTRIYKDNPEKADTCYFSGKI